MTRKAYGVLSALALASCNMPSFGASDLKGRWSIPGIGDMELDGSKATTIMPKGDCGFDHCSALTYVTTYSVTKEGDEYLIKFDDKSSVSGLQNGYSAKIIKNEVRENRYGTKRLRRVDGCTFIETTSGQAMRSLSSQCPAQKLGQAPGEKLYEITLRGLTDEEKSIPLGEATRVDGNGITKVTMRLGDGIDSRPFYMAVKSVGGSRLTTVRNADEYGIGTGRAIKVYGVAGKSTSPYGINDLRITGIADASGKPEATIRLYSVRSKGPDSWILSTYRGGDEPVALDGIQGQAWTDRGCSSVSFLGVEATTRNGETRRLSALRRMPVGDEDINKQKYYNGYRCQRPEEGSFPEGARHEPQWWIIASNAELIALADIGNQGSANRGSVQLPLAVGLKDGGAQPVMTTVICGDEQRQKSFQTLPRSQPMTASMMPLKDQIVRMVCRQGEWLKRGAVPLLVPVGQYIDAMKANPEARPRDIMYALAWGQPLASKDPIYQNVRR